VCDIIVSNLSVFFISFGFPQSQHPMKTYLSILLLGILWMMSPKVLARDVTWSSSVFDDLYNSYGDPLDSSFLFEVGIFDNGFVPTTSNFTDWDANWLVFDQVSDGAGWNPLFQAFSGAATVESDGSSSSIFATPGAVFPANSQVYLWVYNSKDIALTSEWALVTDFVAAGVPDVGDRWRVPAHSSDPLAFPISWNLLEADTALFGAVSGSEGAGSVPNPQVALSLQTYQVPEPGGVLLIACAGLLTLFRRFRNV